MLPEKKNKTPEDFLLDEIEKSGYPLEIKVSSLLDKKWTVVNTDTYWDKDEGKTRDIDINAYQYIYVEDEVDFTINLSIECKKSGTHAWVFFTRPYEKGYMDINGHYLDAEQRFSQSTNIVTLMKLILEPVDLHYWTNKKIGVCYHEFYLQGKHKDHDIRDNRKKMTEQKEIFEAQNQVKKYIIDKNSLTMVDEGYPLFIDFYFPCIVYDGKMFEAEVTQKETKLTETKHVVLAASEPASPNRNYMNFLIDVVHKDYVEEYMKVIECDIEALVKQIGENREKVANLIGQAGKRAHDLIETR